MDQHHKLLSSITTELDKKNISYQQIENIRLHQFSQHLNLLTISTSLMITSLPLITLFYLNTNSHFIFAISLWIIFFLILFWYLIFKIRNIYQNYREQIETLLEEERVQTIQAAKMSTLGEMAGNIAHEINNPLTVILGYAELIESHMKKKEIDSNQVIKMSEEIINTTQRIAGIIKGLRIFTHDDSKSPIKLTDIRSTINETLNLYRAKFHDQKVEIKYSPPAHPIFVACREIQISQVLLNLLQNSLDAIEKINSPQWIQLDLNSSDQFCEIRITDSGSGIPLHLQEKILQPFFTTKEIGKGTGLGLSISKSIIERHQGRLFYDAKNVHTSFVIQLPLNIPLNNGL